MHHALKNWDELNKFLRNASESQCEALLKEERQGRARHSVMNRIYGRFAVVRAERERKQLLQKAKEA